MAVVMFLFPTLYGEGYYTLRKLLSGNEVDLFNSTFYTAIPNIGEISGNSWALIIFLAGSVLIKVYAYSFTKIAGGNGGVFAPSLFTGGTVGFMLARSLNNLGFGSHEIEVVVQNDDNATNNSLSIDFNLHQFITGDINLSLYFDQQPGQISWELLNNNEEVLYNVIVLLGSLTVPHMILINRAESLKKLNL